MDKLHLLGFVGNYSNTKHAVLIKGEFKCDMV